MTDVIQYTVQALSLGGLYALLALGVALVFSVGGIVNFAHTQLIAIPMYVVVATGHLPWPLTVAAAVLSAVVLAVVMEGAVFRPARGADQSTYLILSFALALAIEALLMVLIGPTPKATGFGASLARAVHFVSIGIPAVNFVILGVAAVSRTVSDACASRVVLGVESAVVELLIIDEAAAGCVERDVVCRLFALFFGVGPAVFVVSDDVVSVCEWFAVPLVFAVVLVTLACHG